MLDILGALLSALLAPFRSRIALQAEVLALRHQLAVYQRARGRPRLKPADRILWAWLSRIWAGWRYTGVGIQVSPEMNSGLALNVAVA